MKKNLGWILLIVILIIVAVIAYAFSKESMLGTDWTNAFYDYLNGTYKNIQPVQ